MNLLSNNTPEPISMVFKQPVFPKIPKEKDILLSESISVDFLPDFNDTDIVNTHATSTERSSLIIKVITLWKEHEREKRPREQERESGSLSDRRVQDET